MALYSTQSISQAGAATTYQAVSASDTFTPGDRVFLEVVTTGTTITVTVTSPSGDVCSLGVGGTAHNLVVSASGSNTRKIGPLPAGRFADPTTGLATVTYSPTTGCTAAAISF